MKHLLKQPLPAKSARYLTKLLLLVFFVLIGYVVIAQTILIPRAISVQYDRHLTPDFKQLSAKFNALSKSTELDAYNDPFSDVHAGRKDLLATQNLIAQTEQALSSYQEQASKLPSSPLAPRTENYKKAEVVRTRAKDVFLQSRQVIDDYKDLTGYLLQINSARTVLQNDTADINGLSDLNQLAGQGDVIAQRAFQLGGAITTLKQLHVPTGFGDYNAALIDSFQRAQAGLEELSQGLYAVDDTRINGGAQILEQGIQKYENDAATAFTAATTNSAILNNAGQVADKIDSLQPFLDE